VERLVLRAAGRAQVATGAAVVVHTGRAEEAPLSHVRELEAVGVDPARVALAHIDRRLRRGPALLELARSGASLAYDCFGLEPWLSPETEGMPMPCDLERIDDIVWLADAGFIDQLLIAQDIAMKHRLARYGGHGYDHLLRNVAPLLAQRGLGPQGVERMLVDNPRRLLTLG
jgi:phosphotriesterase-related protein